MKIRLPIQNTVGNTLGCLAAALLLSSWPMAQAQPNPDNPNRPRPPVGERPRDDRPGPRMQPGPGVALMERVLTEDQRESMRSIMTAQRDELRNLQEKMRTARQELLKASFADSFDEDLVRTKAMAVAKLEADLTVLRAKAMSQVQPPLSDRQIEQIMNAPQAGRFRPGADGPRPGDRPGNRPPRGPREGDNPPRPPQPPAP
jgi:Spy/CpxP family protein refolding chaperone